MPKQQAFKLLHCWTILKNKPKLTGCIAERRTPVAKRTASALGKEDGRTNSTKSQRPDGCKKAKNDLSQKHVLAQTALQLKRDHSDKAIAELRRKNELIEEMTAIELFRGDSSAEAEEFLMLKKEQMHLLARIKWRRPKKRSRL